MRADGIGVGEGVRVGEGIGVMVLVAVGEGPGVLVGGGGVVLGREHPASRMNSPTSRIHLVLCIETL